MYNLFPMSSQKELIIDKVDCPDGIVKIVMGSIKDKSAGLITGDIDLNFATNGDCFDFVESVINKGNHKIIFDMANIIFIDSCGTWAIFECYKKANAKNGNMAIINVRERPYTRFKSVRMDEKLSIFETEEEAIEYLR